MFLGMIFDSHATSDAVHVMRVPRCQGARTCPRNGVKVRESETWASNELKCGISEKWNIRGK